MAVILKKPGAPAPVAGAAAPKMGFVKTGAAAHQALKEAEAQAEIAQEARDKPWRFRIKQDQLGKDFEITFLDGDIEPSTGELKLSLWSEHEINLSGKFTQIVCLAPDYCPICAKTNDGAAIVAAFTVVDHTPYTIQNGQRAGEVIPWQRKLYVCKRQTIGILQKYATHHGGLRGLNVTVSRSTAKSPNVGDTFFVKKKLTDQELMVAFGKDKDGNRLDLPFDYNQAAPFFTAEKLADMGFGSAGGVVGKEPTTDLSSQL